MVVLAVALSARAAVAAPRAAIASLRAAVCCAERCPEAPRTPTTSHRCCVVDGSATDPASTGAVPSVERPATAPIALPPAIGALVTPPVAIARFDATAPRTGPPGHPETQKLRC
jgi:hypothetical protein